MLSGQKCPVTVLNSRENPLNYLFSTWNSMTLLRLTPTLEKVKYCLYSYFSVSCTPQLYTEDCHRVIFDPAVTITVIESVTFCFYVVSCPQFAAGIVWENITVHTRQRVKCAGTDRCARLAGEQRQNTHTHTHTVKYTFATDWSQT